MTGANSVLLTALLTLSSILVVFLIIACVKLMYTTDKLNMILDDAYKKLKTVDGIFTAIDTVSEAITTVGESVVGSVLSLVEKIMKKNK